MGALGLRELYVTMRERLNWMTFVLVRTCALLASLVLFSAVALIFDWPWSVFAALSFLKTADSVCDLLYGRLQITESWIALGGLLSLNSALSVAVVLTIAGLGGNLAVLLAGSACVSTLIAGAAYFLGRRVGREHGGKRAVSPPDVVLLVRKGMPLSGAQLLSSLLFSLPIFVVGALGAPEDVGVFAGAAYILTFGNLIGSAVSTLIVVNLKTALCLRGVSGLRAAMRPPATALLLVGLACVIAALIAGPQMLLVLYGQGFGIDRGALLFISVAAVIAAIGFVGTAGLLVRNHYAKQVIVSAIALAAASCAALAFMLLDFDNAILAASIVAAVGAVVRTALVMKYALGVQRGY